MLKKIFCLGIILIPCCLLAQNYTAPVIGNFNSTDLGKEFLLPGADGKLKVWSPDKTYYTPEAILSWEMLNSFIISGKPTLADINGDGDLDVVIIIYDDTPSYEHYVLRAFDKDGNEIGSSIFSKVNESLLNNRGQWGTLLSSPVIGNADVVSGGAKELVLALSNEVGSVVVWDLTNSSYGVYLPNGSLPFSLPSLMFADLDKDGNDELIGAAGGGTNAGNIYIWKYGSGWECCKVMPTSSSHTVGVGCPPVTCDIDNDDTLEIIAATYDGYVHCWDVHVVTGTYKSPSSGKNAVGEIASPSFSTFRDNKSTAKQSVISVVTRKTIIDNTTNYSRPIQIFTMLNGNKKTKSTERILCVKDNSSSSKKSSVKLGEATDNDNYTPMTTTTLELEEKWTPVKAAQCFPSSPVVGNFDNNLTNGLEIAVLSSSNEIHILKASDGTEIDYSPIPIKSSGTTGLAVREDLPSGLRNSLYYGDNGSHFVELSFANSKITQTEAGQFAHYLQPKVVDFTAPDVNGFEYSNIEWEIDYPTSWTGISITINVFNKYGTFIKPVTTTSQISGTYNWNGSGIPDGKYYVVMDITTPFGDCVREAKEVTINNMGDVVQTATAYNTQRKLKMDTEGHLHLAWTDNTGLVYAESENEGSAWINGANIDEDGESPAIAVDNAGEINMCWIHKDAINGDEIRYSRSSTFPNNERWWNSAITVAGPLDGAFAVPGIAVSSNKVYVAVQYNENNGDNFLKVYSHTLGSGDAFTGSQIDSWTPNEIPLASPSIDVSGNIPQLCWEKNGAIYYAYPSFLSWHLSKISEDNATIANYCNPCMEIVYASDNDDYSYVNVVYQGMTTYPAKGVIYYKKGTLRKNTLWNNEGSKRVHYDNRWYVKWGSETEIIDENGENPVIVHGTQIMWNNTSTQKIQRAYFSHNKWNISSEEIGGETGTTNCFPQIAAPKYDCSPQAPASIYLYYVYTQGDGSSYRVVFGKKSDLPNVEVVTRGHFTQSDSINNDVDVIGDLTIDPGVVLTITPGVKLDFIPAQDVEEGGMKDDRCELIVKGTIKADMVEFICDSLPDTLGNWYFQNWQGIIIDNGGSAELHGCDIQYAKYGIYTSGSLLAVNNRILNDSIGIYVNDNAAYTVIGNIMDSNKGNNGMNSIYNNILWNLYNATQDSVIAQANYWGDGDPKVNENVLITPPGYDIQGNDWIISANTIIYGTYWNIGTFKINPGITAKVATRDVNTTGWISIIADSIEIAGTFSADSAGYLGGEGTGAGAMGASAYGAGGAGYGGYGGCGGCNIEGDISKYGGCSYGENSNPYEIGSGGGNSDITLVGKGGTGGGTIRLECLGTTVISGTVKSDGKPGTGSGNKAAGGGSGGSIFLRTNKLVGAGTISAKGGDGYNGTADGGGGAGGRINFNYENSSFSGRLDASGGTGPDNAIDGQPGTILVQCQDSTIALLSSGTTTNSDSKYGFIKGVELDNWMHLTAGDSIVGNIELFGDSIIINSGSYIIADSKGYAHGQGEGAGHAGSSSHGGGAASHYTCGGHGSYYTPGGIGDCGTTYDDTLEPQIAGSGGGDYADVSGYRWGGGAGGGIVKLDCRANSIGRILINGSISANGAAGTSKTSYAGGGGSGGSILIYANTLEGTGTIQAKGGNGGAISGCYGGGAAGGLITLYSNNDNFTGSALVNYGVKGGGTATDGNMGIVYRDSIPEDGGGTQNREISKPLVFKLHQNYPNPFVTRTTLMYQVPITSKVSLKLYNVSGRCVKTLVEGNRLPGYYNEVLEAKDYPAGIYFAKCVAGKYKETKKLVLMK